MDVSVVDDDSGSGVHENLRVDAEHVSVGRSVIWGFVRRRCGSWSWPWARVHMDLLSNFCESSYGHGHLLVGVDELTRFIEIFPLKHKTAEKVAVAFFNGYICRYGVPEMLITDSGREFVDKTLECLAGVMDIGKVQHAINSMVSDAIGMSPSEVLFGYLVRGAFDLLPISLGDDNIQHNDGALQYVMKLSTPTLSPTPLPLSGREPRMNPLEKASLEKKQEAAKLNQAVALYGRAAKQTKGAGNGKTQKKQQTSRSDNWGETHSGDEDPTYTPPR
ncbi:uncharacterized protein [Macrobrachium rosenbergii]|uniref:uncharacterized protein n=1 Tax=Macrobrachium rosenbergii TaxID=79674 RepID=UPI0034D59525